MSLIPSLDPSKRKRLLHGSAAFALLFLIILGVFASNGWLPHTDSLSGKKTGWFGRELPKNASSSWNPLGAPLTTPTPQLSKEYIYAGSGLLAVEDANASAVPPADIAVWRPSNGGWYVLGGPGSAQTTFGWGMSGDTPVPGDFDGDGKTDFAIFRAYSNGSSWYIIESSTGAYRYAGYGDPGDVPVIADFDGDGKTEIAVWRSSNGGWYIIRSLDNAYISYSYGQSGDVPTPADFDGDGRADANVWRDSAHAFYSLLSSNGATPNAYMGPTATGTPVCGDYDGDGKANYAVMSGGSWIIANAAVNAVSTTSWGQSGDVPVQNDYDGDGKVDIAVWRTAPGSAPWIIRNSHDLSTRTEYWGMTGDIPVPAFYRR